MEIRIPYEVIKEAVDKAGNPEEPGTAIVFDVWTSDDQYEIVIERPKEWADPEKWLKIRTKDSKLIPFNLTSFQKFLWNKFR